MTTITNFFSFLAFTPLGHLLLEALAFSLLASVVRRWLRGKVTARNAGTANGVSALAGRAPRQRGGGGILMAPFMLLFAPIRLFLLTGEVLYRGSAFVWRHLPVMTRLTRRPGQGMSRPGVDGRAGWRPTLDRLAMGFRRNHTQVLDHMAEKLRANSHIITPWQGRTMEQGRTAFTTTCVSCTPRTINGVEEGRRAITIIQQDRFDGSFAYIVEDPTGLLTGRCNATFLDTDAIFGGGVSDADVATGTPYILNTDTDGDPLDGSPEASVS